MLSQTRVGRKSKPIILSADDVRSILDGRQTQLRRPCKLRPDGSRPGQCHYSRTGWAWQNDIGHCMCVPATPLVGYDVDFLWGRETFRRLVRGRVPGVVEYGIAYRADSSVLWSHETIIRGYEGSGIKRQRMSQIGPDPIRWSPSTHMRQGDSRIWLRVTGVMIGRYDGAWLWVVDFERAEKPDA